MTNQEVGEFAYRKVRAALRTLLPELQPFIVVIPVMVAIDKHRGNLNAGHLADLVAIRHHLLALLEHGQDHLDSHIILILHM